MYGQNTVAVMPDYANYDLWDEYMGQLWQGLLEQSRIRPDAVIVEVAPGATAKIPQALACMNFVGTLYLIEPHVEVAETIGHKARQLLPAAEVVVLKEPFNQVRLDVPVDAILANHAFDDFLSAYAADKHHKVLFQDISREEPAVLEILRHLWKRLEASPQALIAHQDRVRQDWWEFLNHHAPETVILSQYSSSYFDKHDLAIINTHARELFRQIKADCPHPWPDGQVQTLLNTNENFNNIWIGEELLNAENWVLNEHKH